MRKIILLGLILVCLPFVYSDEAWEFHTDNGTFLVNTSNLEDTKYCTYSLSSGLLCTSSSSSGDPANHFDSITNFTGTLTDTKYCTYDAGNTEIDCNSDVSVSDVWINSSGDTATGNYDFSSGYLHSDVYKADSLNFSFNDDGNNLIWNVSGVSGNNYAGISTTGGFFQLYANPNVANGYLLATISETQGASTEINFYEGGTTHNRLWSSGSVRIGGDEGYLCTELGSSVDCDTPTTGADLIVQDDINAEEIYANTTIHVGGGFASQGVSLYANGSIWAYDDIFVRGDILTISETNVNGTFLPSVDDTYDLGSATKQWKDVYVDGNLEADAITIGGTAIGSIYEVQLNNEAGLYSVLSDVSEFIETGDDGSLLNLTITQSTDEQMRIGNVTAEQNSTHFCFLTGGSGGSICLEN